MIYGLIAAFGYGTADVVATVSARRKGVLPTLLAVQVTGMLAIGLVILITGTPPSGSAGTWLMTAGLASVNFFGMLMLYRAFAVGTLSLVSPIASGFAVVTAMLAFLAGERPPYLALLGSGLLVAGVTLVTGANLSGGASLKGVPEAIAAAFGLGVFYWGLGEVTPEMGVLWPVLLSRITQAVLSLGALWLQPHPVAFRVRDAIHLYLAAGILDTVALVAFNLGVDSAFTTTTTAITSLYSVVTVFLAWLFLRDRLTPGQWGGVAAVISGVLLVSISTT